MKTAWAVALAMAAGVPAAAKNGPADVTVYVENGAVNNREMLYAQLVAGRMFATIRVRVAWAASLPKTVKGPAVRLIVVDQQPDRDAAELAYAHPYAPGPRPVVIMFSRVKAIAANVPGLESRLLAHVIVHEITHVLRGTTEHAETGVRKAQWTRDDYREMLRKPLPFTDLDAELVRTAAARLRELTAR